MNKLKFGLILLSILVVVSVASAADLSIINRVTTPDDRAIWTTTSGKTPNQATVALTVTNQVTSTTRAPVDVVLAIDGSGSLSEGSTATDPQRLRVTAAKQFVDNLDATIDRVGVVHWNDTVVGKPLALSSNFAAAKNYLNLSNSDGGTCIWQALNASWKLLNSSRPNAKKVIVLFSDGEDTCEPKYDFKGLADRIRASGIEIYAIGLGASNIKDLEAIGKYNHVSNAQAMPSVFQDIAAEILGSLENVQLRYLIPAEINNPFSPSETFKQASVTGGKMLIWDIGSMLAGESRTLSFKISSNERGTYLLGMSPDSSVAYTRRNGTAGNQAVPATDINVKSDPKFFYAGDGKGGVSYDEFYPGYKVTVTKDLVPPSDGGCQDIVITVATPPIKYNNTVVFALDNSGSILQMGVDQSMINAINNVLGNDPRIMHARVDWNTMGEIVGQFSSANRLIGGPLDPQEEWGTKYAVGLEPAVDMLIQEQNKMSAISKKTTAWTVVLITGKSEFDPTGLFGEGEPIKDAINHGIRLYTLGIDVSGDYTTAKESDILKNIAESTGGYYQYIPKDVNIEKNLFSNVSRILRESRSGISSDPVAKNVVITESIYPYLKFVGTNIPPYSKQINTDGTTTLAWNLGDMAQNKTKEIIISTALDLSKLPVDVTSKRTAVSFAPATTTPASVVTYTAMTDDNTRRIVPLPEGELSLFCGEPCICPKSTGPTETAAAISPVLLNNTSPTPVNTPRPAPGFEGLAAVLGIAVAGYALRRL